MKSGHSANPSVIAEGTRLFRRHCLSKLSGLADRVGVEALLRCRRGVTAVEMAMIAPALLTLTFGAIEIGLLVPWVQGGLQSVAATTARCAAIGSSACSNVQSYAVTQAGTWVMPGVITADNVTATSAATSCQGVSGKFYVVTITCPYFATGWLPPPFNDKTVTVSACYPMA